MSEKTWEGLIDSIKFMKKESTSIHGEVEFMLECFSECLQDLNKRMKSLEEKMEEVIGHERIQARRVG